MGCGSALQPGGALLLQGHSLSLALFSSLFSRARRAPIHLTAAACPSSAHARLRSLSACVLRPRLPDEASCRRIQAKSPMRARHWHYIPYRLHQAYQLALSTHGATHHLRHRARPRRTSTAPPPAGLHGYSSSVTAGRRTTSHERNVPPKPLQQQDEHEQRQAGRLAGLRRGL